jgi:hypothetical protein
VPLDTVVPARADASWEPVGLSESQQYDLVDLWERLFQEVYVHYSQKRALYGYDVVRAVRALRRQIPYLDSAAFLRELSLVINKLRDQHTQLYVNAADASLTPYVAALPFLAEAAGEYRSPTYLVTKVSADLRHPSFVAGVRLTTWNGIPFARQVDLYAETLTGGRPDARRARALETLTQRPLEYLPPPDELWVDVGYRAADDPPAQPDRTIRLGWRAIKPAKALTAPSTTELRTRRAIDETSEAARRARKLLFQTGPWERDRTDAPAAKAARWLSTSFPDALSARRITTAAGTFGYLRLWTFDVAAVEAFTDEVARTVRRLPKAGLIIDLRSNPGGIIDTAEGLLQLFERRPPQPVQPVRFALRATNEMALLAEADGNGADLADWADSVRTAIDLGEEFSQHLPISDPDQCNSRPRPAYQGPVVAVVDANTFSCGDIFVAGIADHGIGQVVAIGEATGAGGANVWTSDDIQYAYHAAGTAVPVLPRLPAGIGFSISVRRMARSGLSAGRAIEDVGVAGEERYDMTEDDLLHGNVDLIDFCTRLLASS